MEMTITDRRIYGVSAFGRRVDFPLSAVSSVSAQGRRNVWLLTSGGKVLLGGFDNADELFRTASRLLADRQK